MLEKYLKSIVWMAQNQDKISDMILSDFNRLEVEFDAWVATQKQDDQNCIESTIKAVRTVLKVFTNAKILK